MIKVPVKKKRGLANRRTRTITIVVAATVILLAVTITGIVMSPSAYQTNFAEKNLAPSAQHIFGTDWMGRDMFIRTITGLSTSIYIGLLASIVTSVVALLLGVAGLVSSQDPVTGETVVTITNEASVQQMVWSLFSLFPAAIALLILLLLRLYPIRK